MGNRRRNHFWRDLRAAWRDSWLLFREFRGPLLSFCAVIIGGGLLYDLLAEKAGEPLENLGASIYQVLSLTFLQTIGDFPSAWYLELFYFVLPLVGIGILAQGVADFGVLFFNRKGRGNAWEKAVASTFHNHTVLVGLGHLGYRVVSNLNQLNHEVVVIEMNPHAYLVEAVQAMGVPVLQEDATRESVLEAAGIRKAHSLILCIQNDSLNLQIAVKARSLNPEIRVIVRVFDDDFAQSLTKQFGFSALSATGLAAPVFAAMAAGIELTQPISVEGQPFSLARLRIQTGSSLVGSTVARVESGYEVSVVLLTRNGQHDYHPNGNHQLGEGDALAVFGAPARINQVALDCRARAKL